MSGLCGVLGDPASVAFDANTLGERLAWADAESVDVLDDGDVRVVSAAHPDGDPSSAREGPLTVWLWGNVYGAAGPNGYRSRPADVPAATYCARRYRESGPGSVAGLNGDFFLLAYDRELRTVSLVTDRFGTRDVYVARPDPDSLVFSSRVGAFPDFLDGLRFDPGYLAEYFAYRRAFGVATPLSGVELLQPGSVTAFDLDAGTLDTERYWAPVHHPVDRPFPWFVEEFTDRFRTALAERTAAGGRYGLLLSGGSDSRLVLAALEDDIDLRTYHIASWMSREARTAERIAIAAGVDFDVFRRDPEYVPRLLERVAPMNNYVQRFQQAHAEGFVDRLRAENDALFTNHFADVLYKGNHVPTRSVWAGPLGRVDLPLVRPVENVDAYRADLERPTPAFVTGVSVPDVLAENLRPAGGGAVHHGVRFDSVRDLALFGRVYPATNGTDSFFRRSLHENVVHHVPLLDTRLLDLLLQMPARYLVQRNVVNAAVSRLAPDLAAIPHPDSGLSLSRSVPVSQAAELGRAVWRQGLSMEEAPPLPQYAHMPWDDPAELVRVNPFVRECIERNAEILDRLPFLDYDGALSTYRDHMEGAVHTRTLFALATFLEMPVTHRVTADAY